MEGTDLVNPAVCHGRACVRGTRIMVSVVMDNLAVGVPRAEILESYPPLVSGDIAAVLFYANEDLPKEFATALRDAAFDADTVGDERLSGADDIRPTPFPGSSPCDATPRASPS